MVVSLLPSKLVMAHVHGGAETGPVRGFGTGAAMSSITAAEMVEEEEEKTTSADDDDEEEAES
jgi:hypothetical protein